MGNLIRKERPVRKEGTDMDGKAYKRGIKKGLLAFFSAFLLLLSSCGSVPSDVKAQSDATDGIEKLEVHFIDVGQGDATLVKCGGQAMLIDAGENDKGTLVQNYIGKQGVEGLDYLIVTHPDSDHCGGADVIITKYDIDTVIMPNYSKDTASYRDVVQALDYKNYQVTEPKVGDSYRLGDAKFTIIAPNKEDYGDEANNYSVGILLEHGSKKFVFTGDAEEEAERDMIGNGIDISADVLKAGHHGSRTASMEDFVSAVHPEYAVISCGEDNEYGHPHAATLNTFRSLGIKIFRTDEQGSLIAMSDGKTVTWNAAPSDTWKAGEPVLSSSGITAEQDAKRAAYILNTKTQKFHRPSCDSLPTKNRKDSTQSRDEIIAQGYEPCGRCAP